jgi:CheY-like chemotaxis protein
MLVDDNADAASTLQELVSLGHVVTTALDGAGADGSRS